MNWSDHHEHQPHASFDGGDLDCGSGLLLLIRRHIDPLEPGQLLEVQSTDSSVEEDLPAWSRLTGNEMVSRVRRGHLRSYLIRKAGRRADSKADDREPPITVVANRRAYPFTKGLPPFAVAGIGSWPRPQWLLRALHDRLEGRLSENDFELFADDAVRLSVAAQERAGVDLITDGEQRRDSYASFVGNRLDNCQLVPIVDLLPYVHDPQKFAADLKSLDVPAQEVRQPVALGRLGRSRPLALHELKFVQSISSKPVKVALPGPYLLTRMLALECVSDRVYPTREALADDLVPILRAEISDLLAHGAAIVQLDEPVLTDVVFGRPNDDRGFMCGALAARQNPGHELEFACGLLRRVFEGFPPERLAMHVCRGNWSRDEGVALSGPYSPLLPLFQQLPVGTFFLELCTPRAGEVTALRGLPSQCRLGVGAVNPKTEAIESVDDIMARAEAAIAIFGPNRVLLNPDCGFATFADNPVSSAAIAEQKLAALCEASRRLRGLYANRAWPVFS
jgi:5-methyltetrahydropteroyltriglutamate--homocysteine methyltransferase